MSARRRPILVAVAMLSLAGVPLTAAAAAGKREGGPRADQRHDNRRRALRRAADATPAPATPAPLVFGIYPGGAAGTVGPSGQPVPEDPSKRLAALEQLRPVGRPFIVRLYASYSGPGGPSAAEQVGGDIGQYTAAGFQVELVLAYRPADGGSAGDVSGFADFVASTVEALGPNPDVVSLQVTNEANVDGAPNASDGYYTGAKDALIRGVIVAKRAIRSGSFDQLKVGFNWAYAGDSSPRRFWQYLGQHGGGAFLRSLDWVGLDIYPGTWSRIAAGRSLKVGTADAVDYALRELRTRYLPIAGIPARVPLHIAENGYPTGSGRTDQMQVVAMRAAITAVESARTVCNVSNYNWFDLRDANSASPSFQDRYGLLYDDSTPKPAFNAYARLVAQLSIPHAAARPDREHRRC